ncbi:MAG: acetyl-CoA carboxylase biotin carboxyl carrier protein [Phycisphaerae bacterium]
MLDIDKIKRLIEVMVANDLVEISLRDGEEEVNLRRPNPAGGGAPGLMSYATDAQAASIEQAPAQTDEQHAQTDDAELIEITSPMVGTFYAASSPEAPPFVKVGQTVHVGMVLCILEAMKVFNEIKSEISGRLERVVARNAEPVEFGQTLFLIRPE